jgi:hypothetical protein
VDEHIPGLADAEGAVGGLIFHRGIPSAVKMDDMGRRGEIEPCCAPRPLSGFASVWLSDTQVVAAAMAGARGRVLPRKFSCSFRWFCFSLGS